MNTVHTVITRSLLATAVLSFAATVGGAQSAGTGGVVVMRSAAGGGTLSANHREIPAAAAQALIAAHHPDVIDGSLDPAIVTLVLDADNNYVASAAAKPAQVIRAADGSVAAAAGTFTAVGGSVTAAPVMTGGSISSATPTATITVAGIGPIDSSLIDEMFFTNYAAGDIGPNAVRVRFIILKPAK